MNIYPPDENLPGTGPDLSKPAPQPAGPGGDGSSGLDDTCECPELVCPSNQPGSGGNTNGGTNSGQATTGGTANGAKCHFPFTFKNKEVSIIIHEQRAMGSVIIHGLGDAANNGNHHSSHVVKHIISAFLTFTQHAFFKES